MFKCISTIKIHYVITIMLLYLTLCCYMHAAAHHRGPPQTQNVSHFNPHAALGTGPCEWLREFGH